MKFNEKASIKTSIQNDPTRTTNAEGGTSFKLSPKAELYSRVASCLIGAPKFYESGKSSDEALLNNVKTVLKDDPEFVLKLALYTREKLYLRSVTTMLLAEYANNTPGTVSRSRDYIARAIQRPDDMTELISYQFARNVQTGRKTKLPMAIKNGIAKAFPKFNEYRLAKYNRDGTVKLKDTLFLTHPKPRDEDQAKTWESLINDKLTPPDTWEVMRSTEKMTWSQVVRDVFHKDGKTNNYMAIIRNLRNVISDPSTTVDDMSLLCSMIADRDAIKYSKMLPFRYLSAYSELRNMNTRHDMSDIYEALESGVRASIENVPKLPGKTIVAIDTSGSMGRQISEKSKVTSAQIAMMLGMMSRRICENVSTVTFDTRQTWQNLPDKSILRNAYDARSPGGATYGSLVLEDMINSKMDCDRLIFLTDMVLYEDHWMGSNSNSVAELWTKYNRMFPNSRLYNIDLAGYGQSTISEKIKSARNIAGWSDRILEMIGLLENGSTAIEEIQKISL